ncbi:MAG: MerR family transcriptional regulator [Bacteroidia bacterium]
MKNFGVKDVASLSGVSVRTLHYYDQIGLLKPLQRTEAGYRYYGEEELLRLQQILFFKELDFPLKEIVDLLDEPDFDMIGALEDHKQALKARQKRIVNLLQTIDKTIIHLKEDNIMSNPEELYEGLPKEFGTTYRKEAIDAYGKETIEQSEKELMKMGKDGFKKLQAELEDVSGELFKLRSEDPKSIKVQQLIGLHYEIIRKFWGTAHKKDKQAEAYAGLGQLYVDDERFTTVEGKPQPEYAKFLQKAMSHFAETVLK